MFYINHIKKLLVFKKNVLLKLIKKNNITKEDDKNVDRICKTLKSDDESLENLNAVTNLEKINVNNELSSCSLYAINVTTE